MTQEQKKKNIKKKKMIIIVGFIILLLLILAIIGGTVFYFMGKNKELDKKEGNTLYYSENEKGDDENNVLVVELGGDNQNDNTNEVNSTNEENQSDKKDEGSKTTNKTNSEQYYIKINNQANVVTIYKKDSNGKFTVPVKAMICSIGTATPESGVYKMSDKYTWRLLQGNVYGQYACRITGHILFHSVPYEKQDKSTLEWWEYDKLGTKASLGCIRLKVEDAKWIYDNCAKGTQVEFYSDSNPGPLGKPSAQKISEDEAVRNWDPTDPDKNNPWKNYKKDSKDNSTVKETSTKPTQNTTTLKDTNTNVVSKNEITTTTSKNERASELESNNEI